VYAAGDCMVSSRLRKAETEHMKTFKMNGFRQILRVSWVPQQRKQMNGFGASEQNNNGVVTC